VAGFETGVEQRLPDGGQLVERRAEQVDALTAGDFAVEVKAFGDLADGDQSLRSDLAAGNARTTE